MDPLQEKYKTVDRQSAADDPAAAPAEGYAATTLKPGDRNYRAYIGEASRYDLMSAAVFQLLTAHGLRERHYLLDVGCGSLRLGRLAIPYLLPGRFFGIEPERWLVEEGIRLEIGRDLIAIKQPNFSYNADFDLACFGRKFDFILAHSIFSHAAPAQVRKCLSGASGVLAPGGLLLASFLCGRKDYAGDEWVYPAIIPYRRSTIASWAEEAGLACRTLDWYSPNAQTWLRIHRQGEEKLLPEVPPGLCCGREPTRVAGRLRVGVFGVFRRVFR